MIWLVVIALFLVLILCKENFTGTGPAIFDRDVIRAKGIPGDMKDLALEPVYTYV